MDLDMLDVLIIVLLGILGILLVYPEFKDWIIKKLSQ